MQTLTGIKLFFTWSIKLNIYFLYWYFQQNHYLSTKKHAVYNIHRLVWGSFARGTPSRATAHSDCAHALRRTAYVYCNTDDLYFDILKYLYFG
jgi:hypothetical protein